jgi:hypothetical protein
MKNSADVFLQTLPLRLIISFHLPILSIGPRFFFPGHGTRSRWKMSKILEWWITGGCLVFICVMMDDVLEI